jgi:lipopolysaccharide export system permease protein
MRIFLWSQGFRRTRDYLVAHPVRQSRQTGDAPSSATHRSPMIFERSLVRELVNTASAIFIALLTIVVTIALVRVLGQAAAGQVDNGAVLALIMFAALNNLPVLLQLTVFVTILLAMTRSYRDSEMVVWQSSGLGLTRWLSPILQFVVPVAIAVALTSLFVAPWANLQASEFKARFEQRTEVARVAPGQFRESSDGSKVFFVEGFDPATSSVQNVLVNTIREGKVSVIVSKTGVVERQPNGDEFLVMSNGRRYEGTPGKPDYKVMEFERYGVRVESKSPDFSNDDSAKIRTTMDLIADPSPRAKGELVWRIGLTLSVVALAILAIPLSFVNARAGRSANLIVALLVYFVYNNAMNIVQSWTSRGRIDFVLSWWLVHALVIVLAIGMLAWRNRVPQSLRSRLRSARLARAARLAPAA